MLNSVSPASNIEDIYDRKKKKELLLQDVQWIKNTLDTHCKDPDNKNLGAYKKLSWFNFVGLAGLAWASIKVMLTS